MDPAQIKLVLLDRDGVINVESPAFIKRPSQWHAIPGAIDAIVLMQSYFEVAVCSNQSGVGRGLFDESVLAAIHDKLNAELVAAGGRALDVFYCPHHPDEGCPCRKPKPELLTRAMQAYAIEPSHTVYAGDSEKDLLAAENADCFSILVLTGNGATTASSTAGARASLVCTDLQDLAARLVP